MSKKGTWGALIAAALFGVAVYFGPHWTMHQMRQAIDKKDAQALSKHVDFPALKESLKAQLILRVNKMTSAPELKDNPFMGLGQALALGMVNQLVDTMVSPAGVIAMMQEGKFDPAVKAAIQSPAAASAPAPDFAIDYLDCSTIEVSRKDGTAGRFVFRRDGVFAWKLTSIEVPI